MFGIPVVIVAVLAIIALFILVAVVASANYLKIPPNQVAVFTGVGKMATVKGGAKLKIPLFQRVDYMELEPFNVTAAVAKIPNKDGVPVNVTAVGVVRIGSTAEMIATAAEKWLTTRHDALLVQIREILESNLRSIVATMTVEELNSDREGLRTRVLSEAAADFAKLGMEVDVFNIQSIGDDNGYFEALGQRRTAEVKRDAVVGTAEAERDALIKSAAATQAGKEAEALSETAIAKAQRDRDLELARIAEETQAAQAKAAQAGPRADAEARKDVEIAEVAATRARTEAEIEVEQLRAQRAQRQYEADVVAPAEAHKQAAILEADARKAASIAAAQAAAEETKLSGEADAAARTLAATARQKELEAEANGVKAKLLAEAEGQQAMADALNTFSEGAAQLHLAPQVLAQWPEVAAAVAKPFESIGNFTVLDSGGNGSSGGVLDLVPQLLIRSIAALKASGVDTSSLFGGSTTEATSTEDTVLANGATATV